MSSARDDAADSARRYVAAQAAQLRALSPRAAAGDDDAVHDARTATRRLRAGLDVSRSLVDDPAPLMDALRDLGRTLGAVRDPAVQLAWLRTALADAPGDDPPARARLVEDRLGARRTGLVALRRQLRSAVHARLLAGLEAIVDHPWPPDEGRILHRAGHQWHRLERALAAADEAGPEDRDAALHAVRRQARRTRYAAEVVGADAARGAALASRLQDALGAQHDAVLVRAVLRDVAAQAGAAGEVTATYDWLVDLADSSARRGERAAERATRAVRAAGHRWWRS